MCHCDDNNFNIVVCGKTNKRVTGTGIWVIFIENPFLNQEVYILCVEEIKGGGVGQIYMMGKSLNKYEDTIHNVQNNIEMKS